MSKFTKWLDRPASIAADVAVATGVGAAAGVVYALAIPMIPLVGGLAPLVVAPLAGITAAATYIRARQNLIDPAPAGFLKPG